jgi:hypothetical protein
MTDTFNPNNGTSTVLGGLGTFVGTITTAGFYTCSIKSFVPYQAAGSSADSTSTTGQSGLQIVIKQNSTTKATIGGSASNPTPTQPTLSGSVVINAAANDTVSFVLTSSNAVDSAPNAIKSIINVFPGEGA